MATDRTAAARQLRQSHTRAEAALWELLRDRRLSGLKFRRQHPIDGYFLDFYCAEARLAIELDGERHATTDQREYDEERTRRLSARKIRVLRFRNHQVLDWPEEVRDTILRQVERRQIPSDSPFSSDTRRRGPGG